MTFKKNISLAIALVLTASCIGLSAGCGEVYGESVDWSVDLNDKITIKALFPETGMPAFGTDRTAQLIEQATGYKTNYREVADGSADNEINSILSTQGQYHILKLTEAQYHPYVEQDAFLDLTPFLENTESGRILYQLIDLMPYGWDAVRYTKEDGTTGIYGIPDFGYTVMEDTALVWNTQHLDAIGWYDDHDSVPQTIGELTEALTQLQSHFGTDKDYHALGIGGANMCDINPIMAAFDCPLFFYVDEDGKIQKDVYNEAFTGYVKYMNALRKNEIISASWQSAESASICSMFANEKSSCVYLSYWWIQPLCNTIVNSKLAQKYGMENTYDAAHDEIIEWNTRIRGDGTNGSVNQKKARYLGDDAGIGYYTVIPFYMAKDALYIIDYLSKKLQNFSLFYGGEEGVDWTVIDPPADGKEDFANDIIYMKPWSYTLETEDGTVTKSGGGKWIKLTKSYIDNIVNNSMYCTGTNSIEAKVLFHLRETGFDAWPVGVEKDETIITNPMGMMPILEHWAPISILSRTYAKRGLAGAIDAADPERTINITRQGLREKSAKKNGVKYYYWSDDIVNEMTEWYNRVKLGKS